MKTLTKILGVGGLLAALGSGCGNDTKAQPDVGAPNYDSLRPIVAKVIGCEEILALETDAEKTYLQFQCNDGKKVDFQRISEPCIPWEREGARTLYTSVGTLDEMFENIVGCSLIDWGFPDSEGNSMLFVCNDYRNCTYNRNTGGQ